MLLGTIYMPKGRLIIDANKPIADKSAYTVLVVQRIDLHSGPNLILNSDYSASDVPVPPGVGPYWQQRQADELTSSGTGPLAPPRRQAVAVQVGAA